VQGQALVRKAPLGLRMMSKEEAPVEPKQPNPWLSLNTRGCVTCIGVCVDVHLLRETHPSAPEFPTPKARRGLIASAQHLYGGCFEFLVVAVPVCFLLCVIVTVCMSDFAYFCICWPLNRRISQRSDALDRCSSGAALLCLRPALGCNGG